MGYANTRKTYRIIFRCGRCGRKQKFECSGKFRVNANGRRLDVWLIYWCEACGRTLNVPVFERASLEKLGPELYERLMDSDPELVREYAADRGFFKSRGYQVE